MHIEPGVVEGAKIVLSYVTAAGAISAATNAASADDGARVVSLGPLAGAVPQEKTGRRPW